MKSKRARLDGLMWCFDKGTALEDVVHAAADAFRKKCSAEPEACFLCPGDFEKTPDNVDGIVVRERRGVTPKHVHICGEA